MKEWRLRKLASDPGFRAVENERSRKAKARYRKTCKARDTERAYAKEYNQRPERKSANRDNCFKFHHGTARAEADEMADAQGGVCAICSRAPAGKRHHARLHVDHCHDTGRIRGMLCHNCNTAIGLLREDPSVMQAAINYLET